VRIVSPTRQAVAVSVGVVAAVGAVAAPAVASAAGQSPRHAALARPALPAGQRYACGAVPAGSSTCMAIIKTTAGSGFAALAGGIPSVQAALTPSDLRKAYKLTRVSPTKGGGRVVAIVDAFNDPRLAADLKVYRAHFHLPPCTTANGCLHIVNQKGKRSPLPRANPGWGLEESLDLDMVSAICPRCHITLIEATNSLDSNLGRAENTAVARGARYVSNSWGNYEFAQENQFAHFFNHPGRVIDFASGDFGYGPVGKRSTFPASLQYVTSIGGTSLRHASNGRGWTEAAWGNPTDKPREGTASGCSPFLAKPSWQLVDVGFTGACTKRTQNDVSADADPNTGVIVYDTFHLPGPVEVGGTSAATPIITAIYALAGSPVRNTYPAEYVYLHKSHLFDVTSGVNGVCTGQTYLCHGLPGFDGPTGLGTPDGTTAFKIGRGTRVTLVDPGDRKGTVSHAFSMKIIGLDTRNVSSLAYTATGLPPGLHIASIPRSTNAKITGTPTTPGPFAVTVTAKDGSVAGTTHFQITVS
jgi:putative Ig domain-containing protein/subtilase family protein